MIEFTVGTHNERFHSLIDGMWAQEKRAKMSGLAGVKGSLRYEYAENRRINSDRIVESFFAVVGKIPSTAQLDRLASYLLFDELTDEHPDKMTREEYPILSESQRDERLKDEVSFSWAESVAIDGRDHQPRTRDYARKLRKLDR